MNTVFNVIEVTELPGLTCRLEFDEYVPLRFRTYEQPIGAAYVRTGNHITTLMELIIEPYSRGVRGLTVTSYEDVAPWPELTITSSRSGLPVLAAEFDRVNRIDVQHDFQVSIRPGELLLFWDDLKECESTTFAGRIQFLIRDGRLAGVWFHGLSRNETTLFASHARPRR